jgi:hypothetical protein
VVFRLATLAVNLPGGLLWVFQAAHPRPAEAQAVVEAVEARLTAADPGLGPAGGGP